MCDKYFHLDPILEMFEDGISYGIVFISGDAFYIYKITKSGNYYETKKLFGDDVAIAKKHKKGGYSAGRFSRLRLESIHNYITKVSEKVISSYLYDNNTKLLIEKLIISGPAEKKMLLSQNELIQQYFNNKMSNKLILLDTPEINDQTIYETIDIVKQLFDETINNKNDDILNDIKKLMEMADEKLIFGILEIEECAKYGELKQIIISEELINKINISDNTKCEIIIIPRCKIEKIGLDIVGIKWY